VRRSNEVEPQLERLLREAVAQQRLQSAAKSGRRKTRKPMIHLDCPGVHFGSQLDEKHLFEWAIQIPGVLRWEQDTLVVRTNLSQVSLRDLLALFSRYQIPMAQLAQFRTTKNEKWFAASQMYWHARLFGKAAR
jgi:hypothetical protein